MKNLRHKIKEDRITVDIICLLLLAILLSLPMFRQEKDIFFDDGSQHLMRAFGTYQSIVQNGNENIISDFVNGFGYSWNLFYGPLSVDIIIVISLIVGAFNLGFKITMCAILFLAGFLMYKFIKEMTQNGNTALLASFIYMSSPYFFTDIYIRHAVGETMAFVFIPLVFLGLYHLFNTEKNHYYLIFRKLPD